MVKKIIQLVVLCVWLPIVAMEQKCSNKYQDRSSMVTDVMKCDSRRSSDQAFSFSVAAHNDRSKTSNSFTLRHLTQAQTKTASVLTLSQHMAAYEAAKSGNFTLNTVLSTQGVSAIIGAHKSVVDRMTFAQLATNTITLKAALKLLEFQYAQVYVAYQKTKEQIDAKQAELAKQYKEEFEKCSNEVTLLKLQESLMEKHHAALVREHRSNCDQLEQLKIYIDICKQSIAHNESLVKCVHEAVSQEITQNYAPSLQKMSNEQLAREVNQLKKSVTNMQDLVVREIEAVNNALGILEKAKADSKEVITYNGLKKSVKKYELDLNEYAAKVAVKEKAILLLQAKLEYAQNISEHRIASLNEYSIIQTQYLDLDKKSLSEFDTTIASAVKNTIANNGKQITVVNTFTKAEIDMLAAVNVSPELFATLYGVDAQKEMFKSVCNTVAEVTDIYVKHKNNEKVVAYSQATVAACEHAVDMIKTGTPTQALGATYLARGLETVLAVMVGLDEGYQKGQILNTGHLVASRLIPHYFAASLTYSIYHVIKNKPNFADAWHGIQKLPLEKQVAMITEIVTTFICKPSQLNSVINEIKVAHYLENIIKKEASALQALAKVENTALVTLKGITVSKQVADKVELLIEAGQLAKQADVDRYLRGIEAPFITSFVEVAESFAEKAQKLTSVEQKVANEVKAVAELFDSSVKFTILAAEKIWAASKDHQELQQIIDKLNLTTNGKKVGEYYATIQAPKIIEMEEMLPKLYDKIRQNTDSVGKIAKNTGISEKIIERIKNHVFIEEHILTNRIGRFEPNIDMLHAWERLVDGKFIQSDLLWLAHEHAEALIMKGTQVDWRTAHDIVNTLYNWEKSL